jgi:hypothetical protein
MPAWIAERFAGLEDDPQTHALVAAASPSPLWEGTGVGV